MSSETIDIGTSWFATRTSFEAYYLGHYWTPDHSEQLVHVLLAYKEWLAVKEATGEANVGSPPTESGEVRRYVGGDGRWRIVVNTVRDVSIGADFGGEECWTL